MQKYDYLKYDISPLSLSGSDFAIEMSVRGAALKRNSGTYFLSTTDINNKFLLGLTSGMLYFGTSTSPSTSVNILSSNLATLNDNEFYKIIAISKNPGIELIIKDSFGNIKYSNGNTTTIPSFNQYMFVGSNNSSQFQWNDIIDYVKIYRR